MSTALSDTADSEVGTDTPTTECFGHDTDSDAQLRTVAALTDRWRED